MSNAAKLKKKAVELEQKKQFDKALALYIQFLQESEGTLDDIDVPLYNRVGDLMLRTGNASDALNYYEKAVDLYAERGFLNNAIALCNKVLRQSPGRASIYYKLGKISATKGFKSDAKKNFLEYADRMQKAGQINEAFRALKEFADLCPDQDDIRLMLAEQLSKENRQDEALEQLQKLHDKLDSEGRTAEVRATVDRMKSIDPQAVPRVSGAHRPQKSSNLIFLDTSFEQAARTMRAAPTPPARQVSDPDLVLLTLRDQPDAPVSPAESSAIADAFGLDTPNDTAGTESLPLLDVGDEFADAADLVPAFEVGAPRDANPVASTVEAIDFELADDTAPPQATADLVEIDLAPPAAETNLREREPTPVDLVAATSAYAGGPPLSVDYAGDLATDTNAPLEPDGGDLFDFRAPPRSDAEATAAAPSINLDPDVAFPSFDIGDMSLPSADEITSGGSLAAALGAEASFGLDVDDLDAATTMPTTDAAYEESRASGVSDTVAEASEDLELEWPAQVSPVTGAEERDASVLAAGIDDMIVADATDADAEVAETTPVADIDVSEALSMAAAVADLIEVSVDDLLETTPSDGDESRPAGASERSPAAHEPTGEMEVVASRPSIDAPAIQPAQPASDALPNAVSDPGGPTERMAGWEIQRSNAERLLESGDRAGGVHMLEQVAVELERIGDLERALTIVDELIRLSPDSIRHHQKRVELAFRANDRAKLIDAYLELGDALFRSGEERKARAVYQRVLELAPDDPRARSAVESVSTMSPPSGSGAIPTIPAAPAADMRPAAASPRSASRDSQPAPPAAANGARVASGISAPPQSRKPSPLDRSAASNGEFVDLGEWLRSGESPKSTRMVAEEKPPTGDEQADFQEMLKRFKQGVADNVDDEDYESHYDLGVAYKEMGLMDEAVAEFQKALRSHTNRVRSYEALGQCFVEKEQYQVASSVLSRAIALGEGDDHHLVGVLYLLGRATEALSRERDALDYYQRVFAVDIEFRDVAERISAIERKAT